jgi:hypothetical protein
VSDDNVSSLPVNVDFDLDAYEQPESDKIPDLTMRLGGRVVTFTNPDQIDWLNLVEMTNPVEFLRYSCTKEDRNHILGLALPAHKFSKLMSVYEQHFKIEDRVNELRRAERVR